MELGLEQVAAHYAISSVFSSFGEETQLFCYNVRSISYDIYNSGRGRLALGRAHIASAITGEHQTFSFSRFAFRRPEHYRGGEGIRRGRRGGVRGVCEEGRGAGAAGVFP
jgi:hypothetical protein